MCGSSRDFKGSSLEEYCPISTKLEKSTGCQLMARNCGEYLLHFLTMMDQASHTALSQCDHNICLLSYTVSISVKFRHL